MSLQKLSLTHLVREPLTASQGKPPLLILAHGYGSHEADLFDLADYLDDRFFVVSVRAPLSMGGGAYAWYPLDFTASGIEHKHAEARAGREALAAFVDEVTKAYDVDTNRVYLAGFSQGGIMSLAVGLTHPTKVSGVVVMSGLLLPEVIAEAATGGDRRLPVIAVHGKWDEVIPVSFGRDIAAGVADLPVDFTYHEYPMGHQVSAESLADIDAWLRARISV